MAGFERVDIAVMRAQQAALGIENPTALVLAEVGNERLRQQDGEAYRLVHDDAHSVNDWIALIARYVGRAADEADLHRNPDGYRRRLIQAAAIAVAAVESFDRAIASTGVNAAQT